jgi:hypothetical protein
MTLRALALVPMHNSKGKKDVTGAFFPEALKWMATHGVRTDSLRRFDNTAGKSARRQQVHDELIRNGYTKPLEHVAFFCHGLKDSIQTGHTCRTWGVHTTRTLADLVLILDVVCERDVKVTLYCCDTARDGDGQRSDDIKPGPGGDGGFADVLRDLMSAKGFSGGWIDAHTVTAHTTKAPYVRRFYTDGSPNGGAGGDWLVDPRSPLWRKWARLLRSSPLRWEFPRLTTREIHERLG